MSVNMKVSVAVGAARCGLTIKPDPQLGSGAHHDPVSTIHKARLPPVGAVDLFDDDPLISAVCAFHRTTAKVLEHSRQLPSSECDEFRSSTNRPLYR